MTLKPLSLCAIALLTYAITHAQSDSSQLRAGNFNLSYNFTQHTTITGAQIEKMPFSTLEEVINVYFNGAYTNAGNVVYIIDGNIGADVNAYSAHDIESITLIHDARTSLNEAKSGKQLVLVNTKTGSNKQSGFTIAASEHLVKDSTLSPFHRLYVSGRKYFGKMGIGASASYLHEVFPVGVPYKITSGTENRFNRLAFNGWLSADLGKSELIVRFNTSPTDSSAHYIFSDNYQIGYDFNQKTNYLQLRPTATLITNISKHFDNEVNVSYWNYSNRFVGKYKSNSTTAQEDARESARITNNLIILRERFGYTAHSGAWTFNPSLNLTGIFATVKTKEDAFYTSTNGGMAAGNSRSKLKQNQFTISPTFDIHRSDVFGLQAGAQYRTSHSNNQKDLKEKIYPFGSINVDVVKLFNETSKGSLLLHASHASTRSDLVNYHIAPTVVYVFSNGNIDTVVLNNDYSMASKPQRVTDAGFTAKLSRSIRLLYTYETNSFYINIPASSFPIGGGAFNYVTDAAVKLNTHRAGIELKTSEAAAFQYKGSASLYKVQSSFDFENKQIYWEVTYKDYYPRVGLSGGITNDVFYKNFSAGLNALYYFNENNWLREDDGTGALRSTLHKKNSIMLQHVYAALQVKNVNYYVSARNLFGSEDASFLNANRKYFGVGVKADL